MGRRATAAGRAATRNRNRRAATARSGADSRAAPCGASVPTAGGCGCRARTARRSRRRGSTRGVATRLAVGPAARAHRRDEHDASRRRSCRPSFAVAFEHRLARPTAKPVAARPIARAATTCRGMAWHGQRASRPSSRCGRSSSTATPATSPPSKGTDQIRAEIHCKGLGGDPGAGAGDGRAPSTTGERGYRVDGEVLRRLIREAGGGVRVRDLAGRTGTATAMRGGLVVVTYPGRRGAAGSGMAHVGSHADAAYGPRGWPVRRFPGLGRCPWNVDVALPALIVDAGPDAVARFLEFFAGRIANARTRAAYGRAVGQFLAWCEARGLGGGSGSTRRAGSGTTFRLTIGRRRPSTPTSRRPRSRSRRRRSSRAWPRRGGS